MPSTTGQWMDAPDGARWFFDSGALCLDFGYTGDWGLGVAAWEQLHSPDDLTAWLDGRFGGLRNPCDATLLTRARELRAAITATALDLAGGRQPSPAHVDVINRWAMLPPVSPHLAGGSVGRPPAGPWAALASVAHDAVRVFGETAGRIRECAADDCRLIFLDTSRPGRRRWCSMSRCGNRAKARAHHARRA